MSSSSPLPMVTLCTPTFNRRPFIPAMLRCIELQDYPKDRIEWLIIDDGTDHIGDLVSHLPHIKYFAFTKKMALGEKRNLLHNKASGDILIYIDDDDYYPPQRISHAVEMLEKNPQILCAGSSIMHIYFKHLQKMYEFGPYGTNHATAATFAIRRKLLKRHKNFYEHGAAVAEEKKFLRNFTEPVVQLDVKKTILVFSHEHNSFDKRRLLENMNPQYVRESKLTLADFLTDPLLLKFYTSELEEKLQQYAPGSPQMKPDVLQQMEELTVARQKVINNQNLNNPNHGNILLKLDANSPPQSLSLPQVVDILSKQHNTIQEMQNLLRGKDMEIDILTKEIVDLRKMKIL
jgi:hypothetical protein